MSDKECKRAKWFKSQEIHKGLLELPKPFVWSYVMEHSASAVAWLGQIKCDELGNVLLYCIEVFGEALDTKTSMKKVIDMINDINVPCATVRWIAFDDELLRKVKEAM